MKQKKEVRLEPAADRLCLASKSQRLLSVRFRSNIDFWKLPDLTIEKTLDTQGICIDSLCISSEENYLVAASWRDGSRIYISREGEFDSETYRRFANVGIFAFKPDSSLLIWQDGQYISRDLERGENRFIAGESGERGQGVCVHPDGDLVAFSSCWQGGSEVTLLKLSDSNYRRYIYLPYDELTPPTFSANGEWLAVGHHYPEIYRLGPKEENWQLSQPRYRFGKNGELLSEFQGSSTVDYRNLWTRQLFDVKRQLFIAGSPEGKIFAWNLSDGSLHSQVQAHKGKVFDIAFSDAHDLLFSCGADKFVRSWHLDE